MCFEFLPHDVLIVTDFLDPKITQYNSDWAHVAELLPPSSTRGGIAATK